MKCSQITYDLKSILFRKLGNANLFPYKLNKKCFINSKKYIYGNTELQKARVHTHITISIKNSMVSAKKIFLHPSLSDMCSEYHKTYMQMEA